MPIVRALQVWHYEVVEITWVKEGQRLTERYMCPPPATWSARIKGGPMTVEQIAKVAHETNRAYCDTLGDITQIQQPWDGAPPWQRDSEVKGVEFHLAAHANGLTPSPSASHESWLEEKRREGWGYGPVKDAEKKVHPCFVPYDALPPEQKVKDHLFGAVVAAFVQAGLAPKLATQG